MSFNVEALSDHLFELIISVVCIVLTVLLKPLLKKLLDMIAAKINSTDNETQTKIASNALKILDQLVTTTVAYLEQEYATEIRKGIESGDRSREELYALKDKAVEIVTSQLTDSVKESLGTQISDIGKYIDNLVSEKVFDIKSGIKVLTGEVVTKE